MKRVIKFRAWDRNERDRFRMKYNLSLNSAYFQQETLKGIEVMQFTGLTDKDDTEIYEGDILSFNGHAPVASVEIREGCVRIGDSVLARAAKSSRVAGNIHENPELLKKED